MDNFCDEELFDSEKWICDDFPTDHNLKLFDDVGFIYEIELAKRELSKFYDDLDSFGRRTAYFELVNGERSLHYHISNIRGKGQIGRTNQYLTHWWYPYKAKFHPQMVKALINWMGLKEGDLLLDPFCGSGTALVEAKTVGVNSIGVDVSPLCCLISDVKCNLLYIPYEKLIDFDRDKIILHFDKKLKKIKRTKELDSFTSENKEEVNLSMGDEIYNFYKSAYLYALSDNTYVNRDMTKGFNKNLDMILENVKRFDTLKDKFHIKLGEHEVRRADARYLDVRDNEIDGILTSPPYSIAVDYIKNDLHALEFFGEDPNKLRDKMVGLRGDRRDKIKNYYLDMKRSIDEMYRVLKDGGYCTIIIGDNTVNGRRLKNEEKFIKLGKESGFTFIKTIRRPILGGFARLRYEYVILFRKF